MVQMRGRLVAVTVLTAVLSIFTGFVTNLLSDQTPPNVAQFARPVLGLCVLATVILAALTIRATDGSEGVRSKPHRVRNHSDPISLGVHPAEHVGQTRSPAYV